MRSPDQTTMKGTSGLASAALAIGSVVASAFATSCASGPPPWFLEWEWSPEPLVFDGQRWDVRDGSHLTGAGPSLWSRQHARVDPDGRLRLTLAERDGQVWGAEISTPAAPGYGRLEVEVELDPPLEELDPEVVVGLFLYRDDTSEIDVELTRWGVAADHPAQFVVQPARTGRIHRFTPPSRGARVAACIGWGPDEVAFSLRADDGPTERWAFSGPGRPVPDRHRVHLNLWRRGGPGTGLEHPVQVTVTRARFLPRDGGACF